MTDLISRLETASETAWVVMGSSGQWSDWSQWVVAVYACEQDAKDRVGTLSAQTREHWSKKPTMESHDYESGKWGRANTRWENAARKIDSGADAYDQPNYTAREAPFFSASNPIGEADAGEPS